MRKGGTSKGHSVTVRVGEEDLGRPRSPHVNETRSPRTSFLGPPCPAVLLTVYEGEESHPKAASQLADALRPHFRRPKGAVKWEEDPFGHPLPRTTSTWDHSGLVQWRGVGSPRWTGWSFRASGGIGNHWEQVPEAATSVPPRSSAWKRVHHFEDVLARQLANLQVLVLFNVVEGGLLTESLY